MRPVVAGGIAAPLERLREFGWSVVDSTSISKTADAYRFYIQGLRSEFSVAKNIYVATRSGWFSCRSVCYLATGRPVVVQDTGFSECVPTGHGLLAFRTLDEAVSALETVESNYAYHQAASREVARMHFSDTLVLQQLLRQVGLG